MSNIKSHILFFEILIFYLFSIYLKGRVTERHIERWKDRSLRSTCSLAKYLQCIKTSTDRTRPDKILEPETPSEFPTWISGSQVLGPLSGCFPGCICRRKQNTQDSNWHSRYEMQVLKAMALTWCITKLTPFCFDGRNLIHRSGLVLIFTGYAGMLCY